MSLSEARALLCGNYDDLGLSAGRAPLRVHLGSGLLLAVLVNSWLTGAPYLMTLRFFPVCLLEAL
jgi:hypothetical protein